MGQWRGDDALSPQTTGAQLVHAHARRHRVVAGSDPVVGDRGHDDTDPARRCGCTAAQLSAHQRHVEPRSAFTKKFKKKLKKKKAEKWSAFK